MIRNYCEQNGAVAVFEYLDSKRDDAEDSVLDPQLLLENEDGLLENESEKVLPAYLRLRFVNCLAEYTISLFGHHPTENQLTQIAKAAVALIPQFHSKTSESGIVSIQKIVR